MKTHDADIRPVLFDWLDERHPKVRTYEELYIGDTRADVLAVLPDGLVGFEIKSDADTYARLATQVRDYDRFCDRVYLVVGKSHSHAAEHLPAHWGILAVGEDGVEELRPSLPNPKCKLLWQLRLLWKRELLVILDANALPKYRDKSRPFIRTKLLEKLAPEVLRASLVERLFERDYTVFEDPDEPPKKKKAPHHTSAAGRQKRGARRAMRAKGR